MAIQSSFKNYGLEISDAYYKISKINGSKEAGISGTAYIYLNKAARDAGELPLGQTSVHSDWDGSEPVLGLLYNTLKTQLDISLDI